MHPAALATTDAVDARVLADMGATRDLQPQAAVDPERRRLGDLVARHYVLTDRTIREKRRPSITTDPVLRNDIEAVIAVLETRRRANEAEIARQPSGRPHGHDARRTPLLTLCIMGLDDTAHLAHPY